jgi:endoglucanase
MRRRRALGSGGVVAAAVIACAALWPAGAAAAPPDAIRIGGPSAPDEVKVAIVVSSTPLVGERFTVHAADGRRVDSGRLQSAPGDPSPWDHAARADFSDVERPGRYTIRVRDLVSPPWVVERSANRALLRRTLRVFELNADGDEPNPVFGPSHLNDAHAPIVGHLV